MKYMKVMVNPWSSFEQTMMNLNSHCYIPSIMEIGPLVPEKIFEGFLSYMGDWVCLPSWSCVPGSTQNLALSL